MNLLNQAQMISERNAQRDETPVKFKNISAAMIEGVLPGGIGQMPAWRLARSSALRAGRITLDLKYPMPRREGGPDPVIEISSMIEAVNRATTEDQLAAIVTDAEKRNPVIEAAKSRLLAIREGDRQTHIAENQADVVRQAAIAQGAGASAGTTPAPADAKKR